MTSFPRRQLRWQFPILFAIRRQWDGYCFAVFFRPPLVRVAPETQFSYSAFLGDVDDD